MLNKFHTVKCWSYPPIVSCLAFTVINLALCFNSSSFYSSSVREDYQLGIQAIFFSYDLSFVKNSKKQIESFPFGLHAKAIKCLNPLLHFFDNSSIQSPYISFYYLFTIISRAPPLSTV